MTNELVAVVASWCGTPREILTEEVREFLKKEELLKGCDIAEAKLHCNPAGDWNIGGFTADTGLT